MAPQPLNLEDAWSGRPFDTSEVQLVRRIEARLDPWIARTHLPRFVLSPVLLVIGGIVGLAFIGELIEPVMRAPKPIAVAAIACACAVAVPVLGLLLSGAWDLARGPLEHFAPRWHDRLTR
jgi:hypothetical protein